MSQYPPAPRYNLGDHVAVQADEWSVDGNFHGVIYARAWNGSTGDHIYTIAVPQRADEESELMVVHEREISRLA
ncbi:MAG TPA: hypothetical protein VFW17_20480 [Ktedonobacterales bacterium]|nr:hypothetical protein [Ktedonobacterales bacterium]